MGERRKEEGGRRKEVALGDGARLRWIVFPRFDDLMARKRASAMLPRREVVGRPLLLRRRRRMEHGGMSWWEVVGINLVWMNVNGGEEADVVRSQAATHGDVPVAKVCVGNFWKRNQPEKNDPSTAEQQPLLDSPPARQPPSTDLMLLVLLVLPLQPAALVVILRHWPISDR